MQAFFVSCNSLTLQKLCDMINAVIFDLDGTIGNTLKLCVEAFRKAIEPLPGRSYSDEEIKLTFGPSEEGTVMKIIPQKYEEALEAYITNYREMHDMYPEPFEGMREILYDIKAKGIKLGLVTDKGQRSCDITLEKYGMTDIFDAVEVGSAEGPRKPCGIKTVLEKFGVPANEAIYIGDAPSDITYSRQAGVKIISAAWAETSDYDQLKELEPDELFKDVSELKDYLSRVL